MQSSWKYRGGGVFGVLAKFYLGGYLGLSENLGDPLFLPFLCFIQLYVTMDFTPPPPVRDSYIFIKHLLLAEIITQAGTINIAPKLDINLHVTSKFHSFKS